MERKNFFSIVIPCYNCSKTINQCISSIALQDYPRFEIIAVDDMSTDDTLSILRKLKTKYPVLRVIRLKQKGFAGGARNVGKRLARGEIVVLVDSDVTVCDNYLRILDSTYNKFPKVAGVGGSVVNPYRSYLSYAVHFMTMSNQLDTGTIRQVRTNPTINTSYKKDAIKDCCFLEKNTAAEDALFDHMVSKKKAKIIFNPDLKVYHYHPRSDLVSMIDRQKFYGRGFVMSRRLYGLPGDVLLRRKYLLLLLPRFFLIAKRSLYSKYWAWFALTSPLILLVEMIRTLEIFREDKRFDLEKKKPEFCLQKSTKLRYEEF